MIWNISLVDLVSLDHFLVKFQRRFIVDILIFQIAVKESNMNFVERIQTLFRITSSDTRLASRNQFEITEAVMFDVLKDHEMDRFVMIELRPGNDVEIGLVVDL